MKVNAGAFGPCIERIAARGRITTGEALDLLNEVADRGEKMRLSGEPDPFVSAAADLATRLKEQATAARVDALRNATLRDRVLADVERGGGIATAETTLRSLLHGTNVAGRDSIESAWRGNAAAWQAQLSWALRKAGLEKTAISGAADPDVARELWALNAGERPAGESSPARIIAQAVAPLLDHVRDRLNAAGARITGKAAWRR